MKKYEHFEEKLEEAKMIEQKLTSVPTPSYPVAYCGCYLSFESPKYKEDCYFYGETNDMGAIIRFCTRGEIEWGHCPCEKCDRFLSKEEVDRAARSLQKGSEERGGIKMTYMFRIEKTDFPEDGSCDTNVVAEKKGLTLDLALTMLSDYVASNPGGHIAEASNGIVDYESEDATIDAVIDFDE